MNLPASKKRGLVLAVHPTARGVGWVLFESPLAPVDWAVIRTTKNPKSLALLERIVERYHPDTIVLEQFEHGATRRVGRIQRLCRSLIHLAANRQIVTNTYSRAAIRTCFASVGAITRHEIAQAIASHIDAFHPWLPPKRLVSRDQDARLSLFNAAAIALTHFAVTGDRD